MREEPSVWDALSVVMNFVCEVVFGVMAIYEWVWGDKQAAIFFGIVCVFYAIVSRDQIRRIREKYGL